jgi:hypothetical protein
MSEADEARARILDLADQVFSSMLGVILDGLRTGRRTT